MMERVSPFGVGLNVDSSIGAILLAAHIAGFFGSASSIESLPSNTTTADIVGLSAGSSWTHKSPICMHLKICVVGHDSIKQGSTNSTSFPSFHSFHTYQLFKQIEILEAKLISLSKNINQCGEARNLHMQEVSWHVL